MALTKEEIEHLALLARIELSDDEKERYREEISKILDYIQMLQEVNTQNVSPTHHVTGLKNVTRPDEIHISSPETREEILSQFPDREGDLLKVKAVFKE